MVPPISSRRNPRTLPRWQDKLIACFWFPFNLLFDLWVYLTPTYEEQWGPDHASALANETPSRPAHPFLMTSLVVTSVLGFALFALLALPVMVARFLLILAFWLSFRQFMRPRL